MAWEEAVLNLSYRANCASNSAWRSEAGSPFIGTSLPVNLPASFRFYGLGQAGRKGSGMPSINVDVNFFSHRKAMRLSAILGDEAVTCLIRLWCYAAQHHADTGMLADLNDRELEHIMGWRGEQCSLVRTLITIGFLDVIDGACHIHGWGEHAKHLVVYHNRAKKAADSRWNRLNVENTVEQKTDMLEAFSQPKKSISYASSNACDGVSTVPMQCNARQGNTKSKSIVDQVSTKPSRPPILPDNEWLEAIKSNPIYTGIDVDLQFRKASAWYPAHSRKLTRKAFTNWLIREMGNKPMQLKAKPKPFI